MTKRRSFSCKQKIILSAIVIVFLLVAIFLWFNIPRTFPSLNKKPVTEIEIFDGNHGKTIVVSEQEQISYIIGELTKTQFRPEKLAFGFGTAYDLRFIGEDGKIIDSLIVQDLTSIKHGMFFYTPTSDTALYELNSYLDNLFDNKWE